MYSTLIAVLTAINLQP